jgi:hypothetical protein
LVSGRPALLPSTVTEWLVFVLELSVVLPPQEQSSNVRDSTIHNTENTVFFIGIPPVCAVWIAPLL